MTTKTCTACYSATFQTSDPWEMACAACRELPTVSFRLIASDRYGAPVTVLSGRTVEGGKHAAKHPRLGITSYDTIRWWGAWALAKGCSDLRIELERHTRRLGWSGGARFALTGREVYKTVRLANIAALETEAA